MDSRVHSLPPYMCWAIQISVDHWNLRLMHLCKDWVLYFHNETKWHRLCYGMYQSVFVDQGTINLKLLLSKVRAIGTEVVSDGET